MTTGRADTGEDPGGTPRPGLRRLRIIAGAVALVVCAVLVALSPTFGRAQPLGTYRPPLPPDALTNGCYPLPGGARLDFDYQVRWDGDVTVPGEGLRRRLEVQYDLIDIGAAAAALARSFEHAGFHLDAGSTDRHVRMSRKGVGAISATLTPMSPLLPDQIVRGTIILDLPVAARASNAPACSDVASTKRFTTEPPP